MLYSPLLNRLAVDLFVLVVLSANYTTARRSWNFFKFLGIQSPIQLQFFLLGLCILFTCLRCIVLLVLHYPILAEIYTYLFSAGHPHEPPSLFRFPGFVGFCGVMCFAYGTRWLRSYLVIQRRVRPAVFLPSKFTRLFEYWILIRRRQSQEVRAAAGSHQHDLEKLLPTRLLRPQCDSCHFLFDNSYIRRAGACFDLACIIIFMTLLDLYLSHHNGWVFQNMSASMILLEDILSLEYCNILFWFTWIDTIVACLEARFEWTVADRCRQTRRALGSVEAQGLKYEAGG